MNLYLKVSKLINVKSKIGEIKNFYKEKFFIIYNFDYSFQDYEERVQPWVKEQGDEMVIDYDLVKINNHKYHSFYKVSSLVNFSKMLDTEWARKCDKANNCKDLVYKLELVR